MAVVCRRRSRQVGVQLLPAGSSLRRSSSRRSMLLSEALDCQRQQPRGSTNMATTHVCGVTHVLLLSLVATEAFSQSPTSLSGSEISNLVSGRSLAISHYGDPTPNSATTSVWDFRKDGSVCARYVGAKRSEKCAEVGKWTISNDMLCWELPTIGRGLGTNPACSTASQPKTDLLELRNQKTPDLVFARVLVLNS